MKKVFFIIAWLFLSSLTFAQTLKLQVGPSISKLSWKDNFSQDRYDEQLVGFATSIGLDYLEKKHFNLSTGMVFLTKGGKGEQVINITQNPEDFSPLDPIPVIPTRLLLSHKPRLTYISINTVFEYKFPIKEKWSPFLGAGPRFDYVIAKSEHFNELENADAFNSASVGILLAGGVKYQLSDLHLGIRCDHYLNFNDIADKPETAQNGGFTKVGDQTFILALSLGCKL
ncbi:outer membrane beta-barrel protein [Fulvivirgaceae bacterium BMA10]|uniref:Outer membrane beta-barrel protein n=1 Tax=Splendidivirga corallicola TaxID=3051826 RepID=A0ABT8KY00_9BACT|nr:outer membrane beta-barrel protein [Fulvivirgaceae bacterium BMA10]